VKVAIYGLWHLGMFIAVCFASRCHDVLGFGDERQTIDRLQLNLLDPLGGIGAALIEKLWCDFRQIFTDLIVGPMGQQVVSMPDQPLQQALGAASRVLSFSVGHGDPLTRYTYTGQCA
jgi:hypothetical protein